MPRIGVVFTCYKRPNLTELCLRRLIELMPLPYVLTLVYDGENLDYLNRLTEVTRFDYIVTNPKKKRSRFHLLNDALDRIDADYYMHIQNDFYWEKPGTIGKAVEALNNTDVDLVRFEKLPFTDEDFAETIPLTDDKLHTFKKGIRYTSFTFSPHLRRHKYPIGRFPEKRAYNIQPELEFSDMAQRLGLKSGCLKDGGWRHLGVFDAGGLHKRLYNQRFTLRVEQDAFPLQETFNSFCVNPYYRELFTRYVDSHKTHKLSVVVMDNPENVDIRREYRGILRQSYGPLLKWDSTVLENEDVIHYSFGGVSQIIREIEKADKEDALLIIFVKPSREGGVGFWWLSKPLMGREYPIKMWEWRHLLGMFRR